MKATTMPWGNREKITILSGDHEIAEVLVDYGARLNLLRIWDGKCWQEVISGFKNSADLQTGDLSDQVIMFPFPNRLEDGAYCINGNEYRFPINEPALSNALHGFLSCEPFRVSSLQEAKEKVSLSLTYDDAGGREYYPFAFRKRVTYDFAPNTFRMSLRLENTGDSTMPVGWGWHPYLRLSSFDGVILDLPALEEVVLNERSLPSGERRTVSYNRYFPLQRNWDHCFQLTDPQQAVKISLTDPEYGRVILLSYRGEDFPYLQIFKPPRGDSIAIEPVSCNINAFNNRQGLKLLQPGESMQAGIGLEVEQL